MEATTLVLLAASELNELLLNDDAFCGYSGDQADLQRLVDELWDLLYPMNPRPDCSAALVAAWWDRFFTEFDPEALCDG
jgi:hypothetical protein